MGSFFVRGGVGETRDGTKSGVPDRQERRKPSCLKEFGSIVGKDIHSDQFTKTVSYKHVYVSVYYFCSSTAQVEGHSFIVILLL